MVKRILRDAISSATKAVTDLVPGRGSARASAVDANPGSGDPSDSGDRPPTVGASVDATPSTDGHREVVAAAAPSKKAPSKKAPSKRVPAKKVPAKEAPAATTTSTPTKVAPAAKKAPAKVAGAAKKASGTPAEKPAPVKAKRAPASAAPAAKARVSSGARPAAPTAGELAVIPVKEGEDPWTSDEIGQVRAELQTERARLIDEVAQSDAQLAEMLRDSGEGAGDDQADAGTRTFEREQEISLAANAMEMLEQVDRALRRLGDGTYGYCENCGQPIGKLRLQSFPRATLCLSCKVRQERR